MRPYRHLSLRHLSQTRVRATAKIAAFFIGSLLRFLTLLALRSNVDAMEFFAVRSAGYLEY